MCGPIPTRRNARSRLREAIPHLRRCAPLQMNGTNGGRRREEVALSLSLSLSLSRKIGFFPLAGEGDDLVDFSPSRFRIVNQRRGSRLTMPIYAARRGLTARDPGSRFRGGGTHARFFGCPCKRGAASRAADSPPRDFEREMEPNPSPWTTEWRRVFIETRPVIQCPDSSRLSRAFNMGRDTWVILGADASRVYVPYVYYVCENYVISRKMSCDLSGAPRFRVVSFAKGIKRGGSPHCAASRNAWWSRCLYKVHFQDKPPR